MYVSTKIVKLCRTIDVRRANVYRGCEQKALILGKFVRRSQSS